MRAKAMISVLAGLGIATAGLVYVPAAVAAPQGCVNRTNNSVRKLLECVTLEGVLEHEEAFQAIADDNGGTGVGHPGYDASVDYVARRMEAAGYSVTRQKFDFLHFRGDRVVGPRADCAEPTPTWRAPTSVPTPHSEPGDVTAAVTAGRHPARTGQRIDQRLRGRRLRGLPGRQHRAAPARRVHVRASRARTPPPPAPSASCS